jgi:hypothetical protein
MSGNSRPQIAEVLLELNLDKPLDYLIPSDMEGKVQSGSRVEIPLRGGTSLGFVARIKQETDFKTLKSILRHAEAACRRPQRKRGQTAIRHSKKSDSRYPGRSGSRTAPKRVASSGAHRLPTESPQISLFIGSDGKNWGFARLCRLPRKKRAC